jgi:hypothetical protein
MSPMEMSPMEMSPMEMSPMERSHLDIGWFGPVDGRWMGLLDHFSCIEVLDRATATEWLQAPASDRSLLVGLEHRSDDRLAWLLDMASTPRVEGTKKKKSSSKRSGASKDTPSPIQPIDWSRQVHMACVLGEDWVGHRRTFPLPESIEAFYWYQWYDQVIPWVCWESDSSWVTENGLSSGFTKGLRIQRIEADADRFATWRGCQKTQSLLSNRIAWVLSDRDSGIELWQGMLESYGIRTLGSRVDQLHGLLNADLILVDCSAGVGFGRSTSIDALVKRLRREQPDAFLVVIDPFVGMDRWQSYCDQGVDAMAGKPFSLQGILCSWERWLRSGADAHR